MDTTTDTDTDAIECLGCGALGKGAFCPECSAAFDAEERGYCASGGPVSVADIVDDLMERLAAARSDAQEGIAP